MISASERTRVLGDGRPDGPASGARRAPGAAPGGRAARHPQGAVARRGPRAGRAAQPRRRVVPPARAHARSATAPRCAHEVLEIVATRGKMQNPETGSGGMLVGTVEEVGEESPLGLAVGDKVATLVSLTLTPLVIEDGLERWDGTLRAGPLRRVRRAVRPLDRRGDPRRPRPRAQPGRDGRLRRPCPDRAASWPSGRLATAETSSSPSSAGPASPARSAWPPPRGPEPRTIGVVPHEREAALLADADIADAVVVADARDPIALRDAVAAPAAPPTSPSSASTSPAARAAPSSPPPRAARSSSSPWRPRSPRPRWAPRAWPPT